MDRGLGRLRLLLTFVVIALSSAAAHAQFTPLAGSGNNGTAGSWQDTVRGLEDAVLDSKLDQAARGQGPGGFALPGFFTTGRLRQGSHDGLSDTLFGSTVDYDAEESSIIGSVTMSPKSPVLGGYWTLGALLGQSKLDIDFGTSAAAGIVNPAGTYDNEATMFGAFATYSVDSYYLLGTAMRFVGQSSFDDRQNNFSRTFDTQGWVLGGQVGKITEVGDLAGSKMFLDVRGGAMHVDYDADRFLSSAGGFFFKNDLEATTVSGSVQLFTAMQMAGYNWRPFVKGGLRYETSYTNTMQAFNSATQQLAPPIVSFEQERFVGLVEAGTTVTAGALNFSVAGFGEWADDRDNYGARLKLSYQLQ